MKPLDIRSKLTWLVISILVFLFCFARYWSGASTNLKTQDCPILTLNAMGANTNGATVVSYGLYTLSAPLSLSSSPKIGDDLILVIRNIGAKSIALADVTVNNFSLQDANGKYGHLVLHSLPRTVAYGEATSIHLALIDYAGLVYPWVLTFKTEPSAFVPIYLSITNITAGKVVAPEKGKEKGVNP